MPISVRPWKHQEFKALPATRRVPPPPPNPDNSMQAKALRTKPQAQAQAQARLGMKQVRYSSENLLEMHRQSYSPFFPHRDQLRSPQRRDRSRSPQRRGKA